MEELRLAALSQNCPVLVPKLVQSPGRLRRWQNPIPSLCSLQVLKESKQEHKEVP